MGHMEMDSFGDWELVKVLGSGGFGEVLHWRNQRTKQEIATKHLKQNDRLSEDEEIKLKQRWKQEYVWMQNLKTPFIVKGIQLNDERFMSYLNDNHKWRPLPVIVMEYCNGGDLRTRLQMSENMNGVPEFEAREALKALRHAVQYLHDECHVEHRDLKPDNVIIHLNKGQKVYKLTDFGFARNISEKTILKSVVGTRHYFAPEIVDTAKYTKTVDYWSLGIIAYELMCGDLPFIPHREMYHIIVNIKKKKRQCIAITENIDVPNQFEFHSVMPTENRITNVFMQKIAKWLPLALDANYKTRGYKVSNCDTPLTTDGAVPFYEMLDDALNSKILTVFCVNTYSFYSIEVTNEMEFADLISKMVEQMGISRENLIIIFPTGHPRPHLSPESKPMDLFVEEWQDTSDPQNPPVMLFTLGYQCGHTFPEPLVSANIKKYLDESCSGWRLEQFLRSTHFLLSEETRHREAYITGLKEYALMIEDSILHFTTSVQSLKAKTLTLLGSAHQLNQTVQLSKKISENMKKRSGDEKIIIWMEKTNTYLKEIQQIHTGITDPIEKRYNSVLRRATEIVKDKSIDELSKQDVYEVKEFRRFLMQRNDMTIENRLHKGQEAVYNCIAKRNELISNKVEAIAELRYTLKEIEVEFKKIKIIVENAYQHLVGLENKLQQNTEDFVDCIMKKPNIEILNLNASSKNGHIQLDSTPQIKDFNTKDISTDNLLKEVIENIQRIEVELDVDSQHNSNEN